MARNLLQLVYPANMGKHSVHIGALDAIHFLHLQAFGSRLDASTICYFTAVCSGGRIGGIRGCIQHPGEPLLT